jgi:hypothetical protein
MGTPARLTSNFVVSEAACNGGVMGADETVVVGPAVAADSVDVSGAAVDVDDTVSVPAVVASVCSDDPVEPVAPQPASPVIAATVVPRNSARRVLCDIPPPSPTTIITDGRRFLSEKRPGKVSTLPPRVTL